MASMQISRHDPRLFFFLHALCPVQTTRIFFMLFLRSTLWRWQPGWHALCRVQNTDNRPSHSCRMGISRGKSKPSKRRPAINTQTLKGNWHIVKGRLKQKFANLTDNDLRYVKGKEEELIGRIQKLTGATRDEIERLLAGDEDFDQGNNL